MLELIRLWRGYVCIKVWGFSAERFINLCGSHDIFLWNIRNHGGYYTMNISLEGFYRLKGFNRKTGTRVVITKRYGLPFFCKKIKKRKIFLLGFLFCLLFLFYISGFVWHIAILDNHYVTDERILDYLEENNIKEGIRKRKVDIEKTESGLREEFPEITWTSVQMHGSKLIVQVRENEMSSGKGTERDIASSAGSDLVSEVDGVIKSIIVRSGMPLKKEGDEVEKGEILVEGCLPVYRDDQTIKKYNYCESDADIEIAHEIVREETLRENYQKKIYREKVSVYPYLLLGEKMLCLPVILKGDGAYEMLCTQNYLHIPGGRHLPVRYGRKWVREYRESEEIYTKEEAREILNEKINKFVKTLEEKGVQIDGKNVTIKKYKGVWYIKLKLTVRDGAFKREPTARRADIEENE